MLVWAGVVMSNLDVTFAVEFIFISLPLMARIIYFCFRFLDEVVAFSYFISVRSNTMNVVFIL